MKQPLVSIIVPCYNGEKYVQRLLDSVLSQSYSPIELIAVNDGSTDKTLEILQSYKQTCAAKGIRYTVLSKENGGLVSAINAGLKVFSGDYLNFIGQDDYFVDDSIQKRVDYLEAHKNIDVVWAATNIIDESGTITDVWREVVTPPRTTLFKDMILHKNYVWPPAAKLVRASTFLALNPTRFLAEFGPGENIQIFLPIYYKGDNVGYIDEPLAYVTAHKDSHSRKKRNKEETRNYQNEIRDTFVDTLQKIDMSDGERDTYLAMVRRRYARYEKAER